VVAAALTSLGWIAQTGGDFVRVRGLTEQALAAWREVGDRYGQAWSLSHLGDLERAAGHPAQARRLLTESLEIADKGQDTYCIAWSLLRLAKLARAEGDDAAAAECLEGLAATLGASAGQLEQAARLLGTAQVLRNLCLMLS